MSWSQLPRLTLAALVLLAPGASFAGETARFINAPARIAAPAAELAVQYELKLKLPEGRGLARLLLDAGVNHDDAAAAARLAAGHLGDGLGGCAVNASVSKPTNSSGLRLVRATVTTEAGRMVIERRGTELMIAAETAARKFPRLV